MEFITHLHFRLHSRSEPHRSLTLTRRAWSQMLDLAEIYGWNPMGTITPGLLTGVSGWMSDGGPGRSEWEAGSYLYGASGLVMLEDALNLADALDRAFVGYDPQPEPAWSYYENEWNGSPLGGPGVGTILALADFCRSGEFWIERR